MSEEIDRQNEIMEELSGQRSLEEIQKLYSNMPLRELIRKTLDGLKMPHDTGEYKFARLQVQRLSAPIAAVLIPLIGILILFTIKTDTTEKAINRPGEIMPPAEDVQIEEPPPEPPIEPPDTIEPMDSDIDGPVSDFSPVDTPADFSDEPVSAKPVEMTAVALVRSPIQMPGIFANRTPGQRGRALAGHPGAAGGDATVMRALRWLKTKQNADGSWGESSHNYTAMTGLAILTYLAHGETPADDTEFGPTVEKGIKFLIDSLGGGNYFKNRDPNNYSHPIGVYALGEAYAMTMNPIIKDAVERAVVPIIQGQNAYNGWEYGMKPTDRTDNSFSGWCAQAIKAVHTAGIQVAGLDECYERAKKAFLPCYKGTGGVFHYQATSGGNPSGHPGETPIATLCMQLLGEYNAPEVKAAMRYMDNCTYDFEHWEDQPWNGGGGGGNNPSPVYYWYYLTQAKFQEGGPTFQSWNKKFAPELQKRQEKISKETSGYTDHEGKPHDIGYWDSPSATESYRSSLNQGDLPCKRWSGGKETESTTTLTARVMDTCLCALQLMVYYRFLPASQAVDPKNRADGEGPAQASQAVRKSDDVTTTVSRRRR